MQSVIAGDTIMWQSTSEQKKFSVGKVNIGGKTGESISVLIGSVFYHKQKGIGFREETGEFNRMECERLINLQEEFSDKTGLPCMLDVVLSSREWIDQIIDFIASTTEAPILLDGPSAEIRLAALDYAREAGIQDRCVYNSLNPESRKIEYDKIKESGISKMFLDACVLDVPTLGLAFKAIFDLKNEFGYPAGCGAHNAIDTWKGLKSKMGLEAVKPCAAAANALTIAAGADFILYGPIEDSPVVFPAVAMVNAAFAQLLIEKGRVPPHSHPIFRIA
jgi:tetrahydromethanopterin S-methyltransferase subunit H